MVVSSIALTNLVGIESGTSDAGVAFSPGSFVAVLAELGVAGEAPELVGDLSDFVVSGLALAKFSDGVVDQSRLANDACGGGGGKDREFYS